MLNNILRGEELSGLVDLKVLGRMCTWLAVGGSVLVVAASWVVAVLMESRIGSVMLDLDFEIHGGEKPWNGDADGVRSRRSRSHWQNLKIGHHSDLDHKTHCHCYSNCPGSRHRYLAVIISYSAPSADFHHGALILVPASLQQAGTPQSSESLIHAANSLFDGAVVPPRSLANHRQTCHSSQSRYPACFS
jgi:hypothetical protein